MQPIPPIALLLAGSAMAHALWSISDAPPSELLAPLAIREVGGKRQLQRFEAETQVEAIQTGKDQAVVWTREKTPWAFAREGTIRENGKPIDVMSVDCWAPGMSQPITVIQRFQRSTVDGHFHVLGKLEVVVGGVILDDGAATSAVALVKDGIGQHSHVASLWPIWTR